MEDEKEIESEKTPNRENVDKSQEKRIEIESSKNKNNLYNEEENEEEKDHLKDVEFPAYEN